MSNPPATTAPAALFVQTTYDMWKDGTAPQWVFIRGQERATLAEAEADLAGYPKGANLKVVACGHLGSLRGHKTYYVRVDIKLTPNGTTGGVNETGIKRLRSIERAAAKMGQEIVWVATSGNTYATREDFEAGLDAQANA